MKLPTLRLRLRVPDPAWRPDDPMDAYYKVARITVEVLTVHCMSNAMRVRYQWQGKTRTADVPADPFFNAYAIRKKVVKK